MSAKPNLMTMTKTELRAYLLEHREDEEALHLYLDKAHTDNPNSRIYRPEENVSDAVAEYIQNLGQQQD
jgi:hypothetical protein